jgi:RNA polymerase sigma factor (sigma-70 family)
MPDSPLLQPEAAPLDERLRAGDPTAPADLFAAYLERLTAWLRRRNPDLSFDLLEDAAGRAFVSLIHDPHSYAPEVMKLESYLRMSAQGDLRNLLRREAKHHQGRIPLDDVELSEDLGKYLGRDDDPSLRLQLAEQTAAAEPVLAAVRKGLTEPELRVLELLLRRERRYAAYAEAYGVAHLPRDTRDREVKRVKERLQKRLDRARRNHEHTP